MYPESPAKKQDYRQEARSIRAKAREVHARTVTRMTGRERAFSRVSSQFDRYDQPLLSYLNETLIRVR
jgi:hypothetical protein